MFRVVFDRPLSPSMALQPSQNADDIGARFADPSSFSVEIKTTGVPKYKMPGSMRACAGIVVVTTLTLAHSQPARWQQSDAALGQREQAPDLTETAQTAS
jgi:hypothetical protein